jgi:dipeptidyl aminopeptidase/acylaminoacyl peptidase
METRTVETSLRDQGRLLGWAPDGESLFVRGANEEQQGIFRVSLASGEATPLVLREDVQLANTQAFSLSPDGKTLFYSRRGEGSRQEDPLEQEVVPLVSRNLKSGEETELASVGGVNRIAVSPNGGMLALLIMDRADRIWKLAVMPATGGELRELHRVDAPMEFGGAFAWTPDNQHLLFGSWNTTTGFAFVSRIAIDGGAPVRLSGLPESAYMNDMRLSPDGTRAAFNWSGGRGEIWKIENLPGSPSVTAAADQR